MALLGRLPPRPGVRGHAPGRAARRRGRARAGPHRPGGRRGADRPALDRLVQRPHRPGSRPRGRPRGQAAGGRPGLRADRPRSPAALAVVATVPLSLACGWLAGAVHLVCVAAGWAYNLGAQGHALVVAAVRRRVRWPAGVRLPDRQPGPGAAAVAAAGRRAARRGCALRQRAARPGRRRGHRRPRPAAPARRALEPGGRGRGARHGRRGDRGRCAGRLRRWSRSSPSSSPRAWPRWRCSRTAGRRSGPRSRWRWWTWPCWCGRDDRRRRHWDLVVVGAGPAGATAALAALHADPSLRVLLLDRSDFPRDKSCGDGIAPHCFDEARLDRRHRRRGRLDPADPARARPRRRSRSPGRWPGRCTSSRARSSTPGWSSARSTAARRSAESGSSPSRSSRTGRSRTRSSSTGPSRAGIVVGADGAHSRRPRRSSGCRTAAARWRSAATRRPRRTGAAPR